MAQVLGVPFLGEIDPRIRIGGDSGKPVAALGEDAPSAKSFYAMARQTAARLSVVNILAQSPLCQSPVAAAPVPSTGST